VYWAPNAACPHHGLLALSDDGAAAPSDQPLPPGPIRVTLNPAAIAGLRYDADGERWCTDCYRYGCGANVCRCDCHLHPDHAAEVAAEDHRVFYAGRPTPPPDAVAVTCARCGEPWDTRHWLGDGCTTTEKRTDGHGIFAAVKRWIRRQ
jgi:hypothetical protein